MRSIIGIVLLCLVGFAIEGVCQDELPPEWLFDDEEDIKFTLYNLFRIIRYQFVSVDNEDELFDMYEEAMYTPKTF